MDERSEFTYNDRELLEEKRTYNNNGSLKGTTTFEYNDNKDVIRVTEKNESGKVVSEVISSYDERGNNTERIIRDFHSRKVCFTYDENDNCITEELFDEHGNLSMKSTYEYDESNNLIMETGYLLDSGRSGMNGNSTSRFEYVFWD